MALAMEVVRGSGNGGGGGCGGGCGGDGSGEVDFLFFTFFRGLCLQLVVGSGIL